MIVGLVGFPELAISSSVTLERVAQRAHPAATQSMAEFALSNARSQWSVLLRVVSCGPSPVEDGSMSARRGGSRMLATVALLIHLTSTWLAVWLRRIGRAGRIAVIVLVAVLALWGFRTIAVDVDMALRLRQ